MGLRMLTYSIFDYDTKSYNYFQAPGTPPRGQREASARAGRGEHGFSPESLLAPLPSNAVPAGSGKEPRGILARHGGSALSGIPSRVAGIPTWAIILGVGVGAWLYARKK